MMIYIYLLRIKLEVLKMATKMWHYVKYKDLSWRSIKDRENKLADKTTLVLTDKEYKKIIERSKEMNDLWRKWNLKRVL